MNEILAMLEGLSMEELNAILEEINNKLNAMDAPAEGDTQEAGCKPKRELLPGEELPPVEAVLEEVGDDLEKIAEVITAIEGRKAKVKSAAEKRSALIRKIANGEKGTTSRKIVETERTENKMEKNYRESWLKNLMGLDLNAQERAALTEAKSVIPTETLNKIYDKLRENPLFGEVDFLRIAGYVTVPRADTVNDANWVAMANAATDSADVVKSISLGAYKLIKTIEITADIAKMAIPAFETWLTDKLVEKMQAAICAAIINGAGANQPEGVMLAASGATTKTVAFDLAGLASGMGAVPSAYHAKAVWVMKAETFFSTIVPLAKDSNGTLVMNGIDYMFLGHKVVFDDNVDAKIIFGDFADGYVFNFASDIEVSRDDSVGFRSGSSVYRAMALCDGKVAQGEAFCVMTKTA